MRGLREAWRVDKRDLHRFCEQSLRPCVVALRFSKVAPQAIDDQVSLHDGFHQRVDAAYVRGIRAHPHSVEIRPVASGGDDDAKRQISQAREQIQAEREAAGRELAEIESEAEDARAAAEEAASTARAEVRAQRRKLRRLNASVQVAQEEKDRNTFAGTGTYEVGRDIDPGTYRAEAMEGCYWARLGSLDTSDINDNNNADGPVVVEILASDKAFEAKDCGDFVRSG